VGSYGHSLCAVPLPARAVSCPRNPFDQTVITTVLEVEAGAAVVARLRTVWDSFKARLAAGDVVGALAYLSPGIQPKFEQIFLSLGANLPSAAGVLGTPLILEQIDDLAEAAVVRQEGGVARLYFIYFRRNALGQWLIEEM
jgi:hypothetical protein